MADAPVTGTRDPASQILVERAVRMAIEHARLVESVRAFVVLEQHPPTCRCPLDVALALDEHRAPGAPRRD